MYQVTVTARVLKNRDRIYVLAPLLIWTVLFFITFYVMCITDFYFLVLLLFLEVLCIISIFIWMIKKPKDL